MVPLQGNQLLLQRLNVALQVQANNVSVIQKLPQFGHVGLHRLTQGQLIFHPAKHVGYIHTVRKAQFLWDTKLITHLSLKSSAARRALSREMARCELPLVMSSI